MPAADKTVVLLGAAGFIGTALRRRLAPRYRLLSVDVQPLPDLSGLAIEEDALTIDLGDATAIETLFRRIDEQSLELAGLIHLAAYYDFRDTPDPRYQALEAGLDRLLNEARTRLPPQVPLIYASSMAAMAPTQPGVRQTARSPRAGLWQYPAHKLRSEAILEAADVPQPRVELVLAAVYSDWCELVPLFQQIERVRLRSAEMLFYPAPTDRGLTYVHLEETAAAFERALEIYPGQAGVHRLLIGENHPVTYGEIQAAAQRQFVGRDLPVVRVPPLLASLGARTIAGASKIAGQRSFVQPWMIKFAGEHFEFDLRETERQLGWLPKRFLGDVLPAILCRADDDPEQWLKVNRARPW